MSGSLDNSDDFEGIHSMEELQNLLRKETEAHNNAPREELGSLTPIQARDLLYTPWDDSSCPLKLNESLPSEALNEIEFVQNSRLLLNYIKEREPLPTTNTGNLKRKDVGRLLDEMVPPYDNFVEKVRDMNKVINEQDVVPLHTIKTVMEIGGLVNIEGSKFTIPSRTEKFMADEREGELYADLFRVYFREYNIAYFTRGPELEIVQDTVPFTLYRLSQLDDGWYAEDGLTGKVANPAVLEAYPDTELDETGNPLRFVYSQRVFAPLNRFGLLEKRKGEMGQYTRTTEFRRTALFDRFLSFEFK